MKYKIALIFAVVSTLSFGQGNSPFSMNGIGDIFGSNFSTNFSKSGIGASTAAKNQINPLNPASYSKIKFTLGEVGVFSSNNWYSQNGLTDSKNHTNLAGFGLGFPLANNWGMAFGLQPYSKQNYSFTINEQLSDLSNVDYLYEGSGGLSKVFLGTGYSIKNLSIGVNGSFLFGRLDQTSKVKYDNTEFKSVRFQNFTNVYGFGGNAGLQYELRVNEDLFAILGATYSLENGFINTAKSYTKSNYFTVGDIVNTNNETVSAEFHETEYIIDTETTPTEGSLTLPQSLQTGITIGKKGVWNLSAEYVYSNWSEMSLNNQPSLLGNAQKIIIGGYIIPNDQAIARENYWKSIQYNFGLNYGKSEVIFNGMQLPEYGINIGFGFPLRKFKYETEKFGSFVNIGFGYKHRGDNSISSSFNEDYFNLNVSVTLNDKWFIKRKFN